MGRPPARRRRPGAARGRPPAGPGSRARSLPSRGRGGRIEPMPRLAMIHTVGTLAPVFRRLADELIPEAERVEIVDEALLGETIAAGHIPAPTAARLESHIDEALAQGADLVLVTCSSVGPAVEAIYDRRGLPVLRVDEALADRAFELGRRIGVIATLATTLEPTADLVRRRAALAGRGEDDIEIVTHL